MKKSVFAILFLILVFDFASAGVPTVRNFTRMEYDGGVQNWAVAQTPRGDMLFGNQYGMLVYDSYHWSMLQVPNRSTVRSILVDDNLRRVYAGASNEFGYFGANDYGTVDFVSLVSLVEPRIDDLGEVWNILRVDDNIWFQADFHMLCFDGSTARRIDMDKKITASCRAGSLIYAGCSDGTVSVIDGVSATRRDELRLPVDARVCSLVSLPDGTIMAVTPFNGLYRLEGRDFRRYYTDIDRFLIENQAFCASVSGDMAAIGTVSNGVVVRNLTTGKNIFVNRDSGMQNNTVLTSSFDNFGNLWLGLDNGIDYVLLNSPITNLLSKDSDYGSGYVSLLRDSRLYLGTNQGLYVVDYPMAHTPQQPRATQLIQGQVWGLDTVGNTVFVSDDSGLYAGSGLRFDKVAGVPGTLSVAPLDDDGGQYAVASTYDNFYLLRNLGGRWASLGAIDGYDDVDGRVLCDCDGFLWITNWLKGVYRLHVDLPSRSFDSVEFFDERSGLPTNDNNTVSVVDGHVVIVSGGAPYEYDRASRRLRRSAIIADTLYLHDATHIYRDRGNDIWCVSPKSVMVIGSDADGRQRIDSVSLRSMTDWLIPGFTDFNFLPDGHVMVGHQEGFFDIDPFTHQQNVVEANPVTINAIYANGDSIVMDSRLFGASGNNALKIPYGLKSLVFEYAEPEYRADNAVSYSVMLENYDNQWSQPTRYTAKEYTHLREGDYTFRVKAFNHYTGISSETSIELTITPPWYRSIAAKIVYAFLFLLIVVLTYRLLLHMSRKTAREIRDKKEKELDDMRRRARQQTLEKDYEIARLKSEQLEHDMRHKSSELSSITMNLMRKNEILLEISNRLERVMASARSGSGQQVETQVTRIKGLIQDNISHDDDWQNFNRNFDIVYDNFLHRLTATYPSLTVTDQKICAYLKMGLSSKEMASLMNISYRSVEMNRYRLRKKLGLERETNLSDFLRNF